MKKIIKVAAVAIIDKENKKVLVGKRKSDRILGDLWEFPGGKIEKGETAQEAAIRELKEELGIDIIVGKQLGETQRHEYDFGIVELTVFLAQTVETNFKHVAHSKLAWVKQEDLAKLNWPAANKNLVQELSVMNLD